MTYVSVFSIANETNVSLAIENTDFMQALGIIMVPRYALVENMTH